jgi:hypothetical protein
VCTEASAVLRAVAADFFFNCWCLEIPSECTQLRPLSCAKLSSRTSGHQVDVTIAAPAVSLLANEAVNECFNERMALQRGKLHVAPYGLLRFIIHIDSSPHSIQVQGNQ